MNDDSLILGEGVQRQEDCSPFRLTTTTNEPESSKFSLISSSKSSSLKESSVSSEGMGPDDPSNQYNSLNFNTLKSKIKAVQDKYRKSSMTKQLKNKFQQQGNGTGNSKSNLDIKLRSHSHGALPSLDEFSQVKSISTSEEDEINGIWSASQLASKQAKENAISTVKKKLEGPKCHTNNSKVKFLTTFRNCLSGPNVLIA